MIVAGAWMTVAGAGAHAAGAHAAGASATSLNDGQSH